MKALGIGEDEKGRPARQGEDVEFVVAVPVAVALVVVAVVMANCGCGRIELRKWLRAEWASGEKRERDAREAIVED